MCLVHVLVVMQTTVTKEISLHESPDTPSSTIQSSPRHSAPIVISGNRAATGEPTADDKTVSASGAFYQRNDNKLVPVPAHYGPASAVTEGVGQRRTLAAPESTTAGTTVH